MYKNNEFIAYLQEILPQTIDKIIPMFGGYGLYKDNIIFAIIVNNELFFKADELLSKEFLILGSAQFSYTKNNRIIKMCYWKIIPEILENEILLAEFQKKSLLAAKKLKTKN